jgi:hypothetical protein
METIKIIKKHNGLRPGAVITVTTMTAQKRVAEGLAEYLDVKEEKEAVETKEEKIEIETKENKPPVRVKKNIKAPK